MTQAAEGSLPTEPEDRCGRRGLRLTGNGNAVSGQGRPMAHHDDEDRRVPHRRDGWAVETHQSDDPDSIDETFDEARSSLDPDGRRDDDGAEGA